MFLVLLKCSLTLPAMVEQKFVLLLFFETVFLDGRVCVCARVCTLYRQVPCLSFQSMGITGPGLHSWLGVETFPGIHNTVVGLR